MDILTQSLCSCIFISNSKPDDGRKIQAIGYTSNTSQALVDDSTHFTVQKLAAMSCLCFVFIAQHREQMARTKV